MDGKVAVDLVALLPSHFKPMTSSNPSCCDHHGTWGKFDCRDFLPSNAWNYSLERMEFWVSNEQNYLQSKFVVS